jgi:hypothetical protein
MLDGGTLLRQDANVPAVQLLYQPTRQGTIKSQPENQAIWCHGVHSPMVNDSAPFVNFDLFALKIRPIVNRLPKDDCLRLPKPKPK